MKTLNSAVHEYANIYQWRAGGRAQVIVVLNARDEVRLIDPFALEELQSASVQTKAIV